MTDTVPPMTGPTRPALSGEAKQLVLLLHGLGADGNDLIGLQDVWAEALPDAAFVSPHAPFACDMAAWGHQWFSLQQWEEGFIYDGVKRAAAILNGWIDRLLREYGLTEDRLALVGFSQGCMMALHVALRRPKPVAAVLGYSGMLVKPDALAGDIQSRPPVLLVHGMMDGVVPFARMEEAEHRLKERQVAVETLACPGLAHGIDGAGLAAGARFLRTHLSA